MRFGEVDSSDLVFLQLGLRLSSANGDLILVWPSLFVAASFRGTRNWPMTILKEFREFIARGNVIDLAVGVIIGASFSSIVKSLTDDVIMPVIGKIIGGLGGLNFKDYFIPLDGEFTAYKTLEQAQTSTAVIAYGSFITIVIQFLIIAACVFILVKAVNKLYSGPKPLTKTEALLEEIRDLLKKERAA
jgi:large conductance mechanosensitive channel